MDVRQVVQMVLDEIGSEPDPVRRIEMLRTLTETSDSGASRIRRRTAYEMRASGVRLLDVARLLQRDFTTVSAYAKAYAVENNLPIPSRFAANRGTPENLMPPWEDQEAREEWRRTRQG
jgi:hypothetical protein